MPDEREDYEDPAPSWANSKSPDPTGLRPCDRAHLAGWIGLFIAFILLGIGIGYDRVLQGPPTIGDLACLVPMGATAVAYGFAGVSLIVRTLTDRTPAGPMVLICNALIVGPFVVPAIFILLSLVPGAVAGSITAVPPLYHLGVFAGLFGLSMGVEVVVLRRTGDGRRLLQFLRAWLDPTEGQWW